MSLPHSRLAAPAPRSLTAQILLSVIALLVLTCITVITLGPVGWRPHIIGANVDRFVGFLILGACLGLAWPRHFFVVCAAVIIAAVLLEYAQLFMRGRHGVLHDYEFKVLGGLLGAGIARACSGRIRIF